jgi:hypothetical protein
MTTPTLLDMVRQRRMELQAQKVRPITDEDYVRAIRQIIAAAPHEPAEAQLLSKIRAFRRKSRPWSTNLKPRWKGRLKRGPKCLARS